MDHLSNSPAFSCQGLSLASALSCLLRVCGGRGWAEALCQVEVAALYPRGALEHILGKVCGLKMLGQLAGSVCCSQSCHAARGCLCWFPALVLVMG